MRSKVMVAVAVAVCGLFVANCAKAPQQEVDAAKAALEAAKAGDAAVYVADKYAAAEQSLASALAEIEKQNAAFALTRDYAPAKQLLTTATQQAQDAQKASGDAKTAVKAEADSLLIATQAALVQARELLAKAPKGKEGKQALDAIGADLATVDSSLVAAQTAIAGGAFAAARDQIKAGAEQIGTLAQELQTAIDKSKGKK